MLIHDDEFIVVDLVKILNILLTEPSQCIDGVGSLTRGAKLTVTLEMVLADMEFCAGGCKFTGSKRTIALVVMWAYLKGITESKTYPDGVSRESSTSAFHFSELILPRVADTDHFVVTVGTAVFLLNRQGRFSSKALRCAE